MSQAEDALGEEYRGRTPSPGRRGSLLAISTVGGLVLLACFFWSPATAGYVGFLAGFAFAWRAASEIRRSGLSGRQDSGRGLRPNTPWRWQAPRLASLTWGGLVELVVVFAIGEHMVTPSPWKCLAWSSAGTFVAALPAVLVFRTNVSTGHTCWSKAGRPWLLALIAANGVFIVHLICGTIGKELVLVGALGAGFLAWISAGAANPLSSSIDAAVTQGAGKSGLLYLLVGVLVLGWALIIGSVTVRFLAIEAGKNPFSTIYLAFLGTFLGSYPTLLVLRCSSRSPAFRVPSIPPMVVRGNEERGGPASAQDSGARSEALNPPAGSPGIPLGIVRPPGRPRGWIFISHSSANIDQCRKVADELESAGFRCWISDRDLLPGASGYHQRILDAIASAWLVVVVVSAESVESPHVKNELEEATNLRKPFLPIHVVSFDGDLRDVRYFLKRWQTIRLPAQPGRIARAVEELAKETLRGD